MKKLEFLFHIAGFDEIKWFEFISIVNTAIAMRYSEMDKNVPEGMYIRMMDGTVPMFMIEGKNGKR